MLYAAMEKIEHYFYMNYYYQVHFFGPSLHPSYFKIQLRTPFMLRLC